MTKISDVPVGEVFIRLVMGSMTPDSAGREQHQALSAKVPVTADDIEARGVNGALLKAINEARDDLVAQAVQA